jgi:hypothetical protein
MIIFLLKQLISILSFRETEPCDPGKYAAEELIAHIGKLIALQKLTINLTW